MTAITKTLDSYIVEHINKSIKPGDSVLMRSSDPSKPSNVAKVTKIETDSSGHHVHVHVQLYCRPEDAKDGRKPFHGEKELFLSDQHDIQKADTIEGKCTVHSLMSYIDLDDVYDDDYFCRLEYCFSTGEFDTDNVGVVCLCGAPCNPDDFMMQCDECDELFHLDCVEMTSEEAERTDLPFFCQTCLSERPRNLKAYSPDKVDKVKRQRFNE